MKKTMTSAQATYIPQSYKTFEGALGSFFAEQCPQIGGTLARQVLVQNISTMVSKFFPKTSHMKQGQIIWPTVHKDEKSSYGKSISKTTLTPVILDLIQSGDIMDRANGKKLRSLKKEAVARLCVQAFQQNGCLSGAEIAIMLKISTATVSKYIKEWELEHKTALPRRGSIHDMGPTLTHKKIIIHKLFMEQKSVQQTSRETYHSHQAIQRYIETFRQVLLCKKKGMNTEEIAFATRKSVRLINEYQEIIEEFKKEKYTVNELLKDELHIESNLEEWIINYHKDLEKVKN